MNNETTNALLWLIPLCPLLGFFICAALGRMQDKSVVAQGAEHAHAGGNDAHADAPPAGQKIAGILATLAVAAAFVLSVLIVLQVQGMSGEKRVFSPRFDWMTAPSLNGAAPAFSMGLQLFTDSLNGLMLLIITGVGTLIHLYSIGYMNHERNMPATSLT